MIATPLEMRLLANDLAQSAWTLSAIGALFESKLFDQLREARTIDELAAGCKTMSRERIAACIELVTTVGVVVAHGGGYRLADGAAAYLEPAMRTALQGDIRSHVMQPHAYLDDAATGTSGWYHTDPVLLQAQGDSSSAFPMLLKQMIMPGLGDLGARLDKPGARFLDVGVGVGSLSISMCKVWPELRAVGIDASDVPLAMARTNIARAQLESRVALRKITIQDLPDESAYDLVWLPIFFISTATFPTALARVRAALRPEGWAVMAMAGGADARQRAAWNVINEAWGGPALAEGAAEMRLKEAGFSIVRRLPGPAAAPTMLVAQR